MKFDDLLFTKEIILADGAMGTYYAQKNENIASMCELVNTSSPKSIYDIHREYIEAGAKLIRTNTFSANTQALNVDLKTVYKVIESGYNLALKAAKDEAVVLCSMGETIVDKKDTSYKLSKYNVLEEYKSIADCFLSLGAENFIFESLSSVSYFAELAEYIKQKNKSSRIIISFAVSPRGRTYAGGGIKQIAYKILEHKKLFDVIGLNCGCGPVHTVNFINKLKDFLKDSDIPLTAMPNAGLLSLTSDENNDTIEINAKYFSSILSSPDFLQKIKIIGGCCGTTPEHIKLLNNMIKQVKIKSNKTDIYQNNDTEETVLKETPKTGKFIEKLKNNQFVLAAELDPPYGNDITKLINSAQKLKKSNVDIITISDSPMARARLDPVICASKIKRDVNIDVLPHICCRDRNLNAVKSILLGASCEGIDTILAVTGDKIPEIDKRYVKSVFDLSSIALIQLIKMMNKDVFANRPITIGGALNFGYQNEKAFLNRIQMKIDAGLTFFLTQPLFSEDDVQKLEKAKKLGAKIIVGIMPIISYRNALFLDNEVQGVNIPHKYIGKFSPDMDKELALQTGIDIASENMLMSRSVTDGFYFMTPFNRAEIICELIEKNKEIF